MAELLITCLLVVLGTSLSISENFGTDRIVGSVDSIMDGAAATTTAAPTGWLYGGIDWPKNDCG
jgi:hypothetical protein